MNMHVHAHAHVASQLARSHNVIVYFRIGQCNTALMSAEGSRSEKMAHKGHQASYFEGGIQRDYRIAFYNCSTCYVN